MQHTSILLQRSDRLGDFGAGALFDLAVSLRFSYGWLRSLIAAGVRSGASKNNR
jgi:hypothetical protein